MSQPKRLRKNHARTEARDREELGHPLDETEDDRLPVADLRGEDHDSDDARLRDRSPV